MKKLLALVLALVMTLSLCTISNAAFTDAKDVDASYEEAVAVLNGMGVFKGYEDGSFKPEGSITRAEVAAIVYRLYTGDVKDKQAGLYAGYGKFDDMAGAAWAAGYVGFCANAGFVKGYGNGKFGPSDPVTGYQALAMILRAVGYGKNGEFEGADWELHVAQIAQQLKVLKNVKGVSLKAAASRELVAELLFQVAAYVDTVEYTPAFGYVSNTVVNANAETLGEKNFNLTKSADGEDAWGRPQYKWFSDDNGNKKVDTKETKYATIQAKPVATYTTAVTECQVASDADFTGSKTYTLYVNRVKSTDVLQATNTVDTIGAQGRLTEVYEDRIVMIDTLLAKVTDVKDATYDAAGHLKDDSKITLRVYDANTNTENTGDTYILTNGKVNYTYAAGDMVLLNAYTAAATAPLAPRDTAGAVTKDALNNGVYGEILGLADAVEGTQTVVWFNTGKHTVNGTTYDDAAELHLDEAQAKTSNYTWYFDQYGNIIGSVEVATQYTYAVMTSIWWAGDAATGTGSAKATLKYMDGTDNTVTVGSIAFGGTAYTPTYSTDDNVMDTWTHSTTDVDYINVATNAAVNAIADNGTSGDDLIHGHLFKVATLADGSVALTKVDTGAAPYTHTELATNVAITNRYAYITGTGTGAGPVAIDTETKFLVRSGDETPAFTYKTYTGLNELPTFKAVVKVDYVLGTGDVADYVFIIGETADSTANSFVLVTGNAYSAVLRTVGGVSYWELTLPVPAEDGSTVTLKVKDDDNSMATVPANVTTLTNIANHGKLFYVATTNGLVAETTGVTVITNNVFNYDGAYGRAIKLINAQMLTGVAGGVIDGTVNDTTANDRFNITASTVVVGTLAADMTDKVVYVIYDARNNDASKVYVLDINSAINPVVNTITNVNVSVAGVVAGQDVTDSVFAATGTYTGNTVAMPVSSVTWYRLDSANATWVLCNDLNVFATGTTYRAIVTVGMPTGSYQMGASATLTNGSAAGLAGSTMTGTAPGTVTLQFTLS